MNQLCSDQYINYLFYLERFSCDYSKYRKALFRHSICLPFPSQWFQRNFDPPRIQIAYMHGVPDLLVNNAGAGRCLRRHRRERRMSWSPCLTWLPFACAGPFCPVCSRLYRGKVTFSSPLWKMKKGYNSKMQNWFHRTGLLKNIKIKKEYIVCCIINF